MSSILFLVGSILQSQREAILSLLIVGAQKVFEFFIPQKRRGIVLLEESVKYLVDNLVNSKSTYLVDLHSQVSAHLDEDEVLAIKNAPNDLSRKSLLYPKVEKLSDAIMNVLRQNTVVFFHWDLELLKVINCRDMLYLLPSDAYVQALKETNPDFDQERFTKYKQLLVTLKPQKVILFNSNQDLQNHILTAYPGLQIKS